MSYRELRNFTEAMRALGYPRLISVENFRTPNFDLMADILQWLTQRYDPSIDLPKISSGNTTEADRVAFVKSVASAVHAKAQIKLNTKKLYSSDGYAVQELLKLATLLHAAAKESSARSRTASEDPDSEIAAPLVLSGEERQIRSLGVEVTGMGATIHSLLVVEPELRDARMKAITRLLDSDDVERDIKRTINTINSQMKELADNLENLAADEANLETKIERKKTDLERGQNRLKSLQSVRPPFMDEYERLEVELKKLYNIYLERFRNVEYLENELEKYNREEQEKLEESEKVLKHMQTRIREEEMTMLREGKASSLGHRNDNFDSDEDEEDQAPERTQTQTTQNGRGGRGGTIVARGGASHANSNISNNNKNRQNTREERGRTSGGGKGRVMGSMNGGEETESEEDEEGEEEEGSSPEISLDSDNGDDDDDDFDDNEF